MEIIPYEVVKGPPLLLGDVVGEDLLGDEAVGLPPPGHDHLGVN